MIKETFPVEGMSCGHCKMTVENAVSKLDGVKSAKANLKQNNLNVKYDEALLSLGQIKEAVKQAGYIVEVT